MPQGTARPGTATSSEADVVDIRSLNDCSCPVCSRLDFDYALGYDSPEEQETEVGGSEHEQRRASFNRMRRTIAHRRDYLVQQLANAEKVLAMIDADPSLLEKFDAIQKAI